MPLLSFYKDGSLDVQRAKDGKTPIYKDTALEASDYRPSQEEIDALSLIRKDFSMGDINMRTPRREFDDLSVIERMTVDEMSFNTYQPNNGEPSQGDEINAWRSNAIRPVVRNKVVSIAAHVTARNIFPKIFSYSKTNEEDKDAAIVMESLVEWSAQNGNYREGQFDATFASLISPAAILHTEYCETYRNVKRNKDKDGNWIIERELDEEGTGFFDTVIPVDQFYIENFYERNVQKQGFLVWREVISYATAESRYAFAYKNFKYVKPGVMTIWDDANRSFYNIYDAYMRKDMVEVVRYWNKQKDLYLIAVNGILLTPCDNPNPRNDKEYPFVSFGYEPIGDGKCFYYKSLAHKLQKDANIINTLYPMIIDGTYLSVFPPSVATGGEIITGDVIVPGAITTFTNPEATLNPINIGANLSSGINTLFKVEESLNSSSQEPLLSGSNVPGNTTAYEISKIEQNAATVLGLYLTLRSFATNQFGKLRVGDITQYLTIADASKIEGDSGLVYKTFLLHDKVSDGKKKTRKIVMDATLPDQMTEEEMMKQSVETYDMQKRSGDTIKLYRVNPKLVREMKYVIFSQQDSLLPMSEDVERAYKLEAYDRLIENPLANQEAVLSDFLLAAYPTSKSNIDKYLNKQEGAAQVTFPNTQQSKNPMEALVGAGAIPPNPMAKIPQPKSR